MRVLDLFSGIGGFSLGLERAGMTTVAFCETDRKCQNVLSRRWPGVKIYEDVRRVTGAGLHRDGIFPDLICGGFPCQPFSTAARGRNNKPDLWPYMHMLADELRVPWLLAENVPGLGYHGIDRVCGDLEASNYTCWPYRLDTAPHGRHRGRDRFIVVAYANGQGQPRRSVDAQVACIPEVSGRRWQDDPAPVGMDDGVSGRMDRLRQLGNSISPWAAEMFGRAIMAAA